MKFRKLEKDSKEKEKNNEKKEEKTERNDHKMELRLCLTPLGVQRPLTSTRVKTGK